MELKLSCFRSSVKTRTVRHLSIRLMQDSVLQDAKKHLDNYISAVQHSLDVWHLGRIMCRQSSPGGNSFIQCAHFLQIASYKLNESIVLS
jgi:hypothetical protein